MFHVKSAQIRNFFWSVFSRIRTEYGQILRISPYSVRMQENMEQKKIRIWRPYTKCGSPRYTSEMFERLNEERKSRLKIVIEDKKCVKQNHRSYISNRARHIDNTHSKNKTRAILASGAEGARFAGWGIIVEEKNLKFIITKLVRKNR